MSTIDPDAPGMTGAPAQPAVGDRLARDMSELARQELARLRAELVGSARRAGLGAGLLAVAGVAGVLGVASGSTAMLRLLESALSRRAAAVVLTGGYLAAAGVLTVVGLRRLRSAAGMPDRLTSEARQTVQAVRAGGSRH